MAVWDTFTNEKQWRDYLSRLVQTNGKALDKAIVLIYNNQTLEEQALKQSIEDNNLGYTKLDAPFFSPLAVKLLDGQQLDDKERAIAKNKMKKYWKQLMQISKRQQAEEDERTRSEKRAIAKQQFQYDIELLRRCSEEGISCEYGICDECPVTQGLQMRLQIQ